jgi:hypothetical protein
MWSLMSISQPKKGYGYVHSVERRFKMVSDKFLAQCMERDRQRVAGMKEWQSLSRADREKAFQVVRKAKGSAMVCIEEMLEAHREIA